jgi:5-methylcytosine-specific restriction endonuclease McrA
LYNLQATSSGEARRLWRKSIKEKWNNQCAYCGSNEELTIDHIIPQSKGGIDFLSNVVCCCRKCNADKAHSDWKVWFKNKEFFTTEKLSAIIDWMKPDSNNLLYKYTPRKNKVY